MTHILGSKRDFLDWNDEDAMEFLEIIKDIADHPEFRKLEQFTHHLHTNRYQHCLNVSWYTYLWAKKLGLNYKEAARGALLHDFFLYDYRSNPPIKGNHNEIHPIAAFTNAEKYFEVTDIMRDCILRHMWPNTSASPETREGYLVSVADKYCAGIEVGSKSYYAIYPVLKQIYEMIEEGLN
ncbi:MAG: HD domain-containing protein [Solobacterium sp.]|nr:HD domain-containing protein [Solobacterium sp.]